MADDKTDPIEEVIEEEQEQPQEQPEVQEEESPADESQQEQQEEELAEAPAEEQGEEQTPPQMSRRKAKRLEKLESLVQRLRTDTPPVQAPQSEGVDYRKMIEADDEVYKQLEDRTQAYGQAQYQAGLEQTKTIQFHTNLKIDAPRVEEKYSIFNKSSSQFNPSAANAINQWYLATVGYQPGDKSRGIPDKVANSDLSYADFVEGIMELADNMATTKTQKTTENIARQAASTGLRPDGSSAKGLDLNKAPEQMTDEELEAAMNAVLPERDARGRYLKKSEKLLNKN